MSNPYTETIQSGGIKVIGITLANKTLTKTSTTNPTVTIIPTITPTNATNQALTWNSSNQAVATVNASGVVTYVGPGTTTITATATDGSGTKGTCTVTCTQDIKITGISLSRPIVYPASPTATIIPEITPTNAQNKALFWTSGNTGIATVTQNGQVNFVSNGIATVYAHSQDGSGCIGKTTVACQEDSWYFVKLENPNCSGYGSTLEKEWVVDLSGANMMSFEVFGQSTAYYSWAIYVKLLDNAGNVVHEASYPTAGVNTEGVTLGTVTWDVSGFSTR